MGKCFSALQRAENSSINTSDVADAPYWDGFSALQRAENSSIVAGALLGFYYPGFSALQRAENSSIGMSARARRWR